METVSECSTSINDIAADNDEIVELSGNIVTVSGMGGIGKTTLARKTHDHLPIRYHFDLTISQEYRSRNVLLDALHCISKQTDIFIGKDYDKKNSSELADLVQKNLKGRRYPVVVDDDVWDELY
ncbi:hypothetical protein RDI58_012636 [Solanum bulbocastanum]|uniref:NB-ARC domain-containing protein n=1 Tax=Solanum bulbocastanum TaxID=147425 RepID=A0AAN8THZ0_SOLBU